MEGLRPWAVEIRRIDDDLDRLMRQSMIRGGHDEGWRALVVPVGERPPEASVADRDASGHLGLRRPCRGRPGAMRSAVEDVQQAWLVVSPTSVLIASAPSSHAVLRARQPGRPRDA